jgi:hypothetical protein
MTAEPAQAARTCQGPGCANVLSGGPRQRYCSGVCTPRAYRARTSPLAPRLGQRGRGAGVPGLGEPGGSQTGAEWCGEQVVRLARAGAIWEARHLWRWWREHHPEDDLGEEAEAVAAELDLYR